MWWSLDPRAILPLDGIHISRRLTRTLGTGKFQVTCNAAFSRVIGYCSKGPGREGGTWITPEIIMPTVDCISWGMHTRSKCGAMVSWREVRMALRLADYSRQRACFTMCGMHRKLPWCTWSGTCAAEVIYCWTYSSGLRIWEEWGCGNIAGCLFEPTCGCGQFAGRLSNTRPSPGHVWSATMDGMKNYLQIALAELPHIDDLLACRGWRLSGSFPWGESFTSTGSIV